MDTSEITYKPTRLTASEANTSNGAITLTFDNPHLLVKLVEFNSAMYISCGSHLMPLHTFLQVRSAHETDDALLVMFGKSNEQITHTYKGLSALTFATIMSAVEDVIEDNNISTSAPYWSNQDDSTSEDEASTVLDHILPPPNPDTLHAPHSHPLTVTDQMAFVIGVVAFVIAMLDSVYLMVRIAIN